LSSFSPILSSVSTHVRVRSRRQVTLPLKGVLYGRCILVLSLLTSFYLSLVHSVSLPFVTNLPVDTFIGFWRWCITHRDIGFSDFVHRPDFS
jgi:hypothetical protein